MKNKGEKQQQHKTIGETNIKTTALELTASETTMVPN